MLVLRGYRFQSIIGATQKRHGDADGPWRVSTGSGEGSVILVREIEQP